MPSTKRKRRFQRPDEIDILDALICGPLGWSEAENAEIKARLQRRGAAIFLAKWRAERARILAAEARKK